MATLRLPGAADIHVHLRDPGETHKEDFASGTAAALAGGVVTVLAMPNTRPPLIDAAAFREAVRRARALARCEVGLFLGGTADNAAEAAALARQAAGLKLYLDATYGPLRLEGLAALLRHFEAWPGHRPIAVHAEGRTVAMVIGLAALFRQPVHFCHISRREEILLIRRAKERGLPITCEVTPHHLFLTEEDLPRLGPFGQMRPPLASRADQETLWANLAIVDAVATDHAPHTIAEKRGGEPTPGRAGPGDHAAVAAHRRRRRTAGAGRCGPPDRHRAPADLRLAGAPGDVGGDRMGWSLGDLPGGPFHEMRVDPFRGDDSAGPGAAHRPGGTGGL
jgi:dihydroorotase-like cyclic amidohydrolase